MKIPHWQSIKPYLLDSEAKSAAVEVAAVEEVATVEAATVEAATVEVATVEATTVEAATVEEVMKVAMHIIGSTRLELPLKNIDFPCNCGERDRATYRPTHLESLFKLGPLDPRVFLDRKHD